MPKAPSKSTGAQEEQKEHPKDAKKEPKRNQREPKGNERKARGTKEGTRSGPKSQQFRKTKSREPAKSNSCKRQKKKIKQKDL